MIRHSIPAIEGLQDPRAAAILSVMKATLDDLRGASAQNGPVVKLGPNAAFSGVINKINELIDRVQDDINADISLFRAGQARGLTANQISGWTIGATTLTATSGGNTTILSSGATAFSAGPTGAPTVTITQAGVLTGTGVVLSGTITASAGTIGGFTLGATTLTATSGGNTTIVSSGATAFTAGPTASPTVTITQAGVLTTTSASVGGFDIGAEYIRDTANTFGLASTTTGGADVRMWCGDTFANRASAPVRLYDNNALFVYAVTVAAASTIAGFDHGSDYIHDTGNTFGLASTATGGADVRFWVGETFDNRASAPIRCYDNGAFFATTFEASSSVTGGSMITTGDFTYKTRVIGAWTSPTFDAGVFTASGSMTWTVAAGDVSAYCYTLTGDTMTISFSVATSTVAGTLSNELRITVPLSKTISLNHLTVARVIDNGVLVDGIVSAANGLTYLRVFRADTGNFSASTDNTEVSGQITFRVT